MQNVGEQLRRARLEKNLSLDEVYKQTRIHSHVLEALEQDRAHNFLGLIYIKGFLKTYAQFLGLDSEGLVKQYIDSQKEERPQQPEVVVEKKEKSFSKIRPFLIFRAAAVVVLVFIFAFYFRYVLRNISSASQKAQLPKVKVAVMPAAKVQREVLVVQVRTKEDCWIQVKADEQAVFGKTLPKGKSETWQAKERLELRIGKPEALEVSLNGKPLNLQKARVKRTLIVTQEGIVGK